MPHATQHADVVTAELDSALRGGPFHVALRAAIAARGLPLQRVQHHLSRHGVRVGVTSLSYWQQGARRPQRPESLRAVRALENCRIGRIRRHHDTGVLAAELLFDIRLRAGDTFLFRYTVEDGTADVCREYVRGADSPGGQYALQVCFDSSALPVRCHRFTQHSAAAPRGGRQELPLSARHRSVHLVEPRLRAGYVGITWDWG
ncbi:hypothetical protein [Streptomyces tunisiensis]|uniref:hypothetical protein n=1 Tax=Streptomyces tunisiensis TaxID=948699 RepID=UPI00403DFCB8